jgi:hypothetical protein
VTRDQKIDACESGQKLLFMDPTQTDVTLMSSVVKFNNSSTKSKECNIQLPRKQGWGLIFSLFNYSWRWYESIIAEDWNHAKPMKRVVHHLGDFLQS